MDPSPKRHGFLSTPLVSSPSGETKGWLLSLLTDPVRDLPLSLVLGCLVATFLLANGVTALALKQGPWAQLGSFLPKVHHR